MGEMRNACNIFVGQLERERPLGRHMRRWEDNIILDVRQISWKGVDWMHSAQYR
jgi:hypothetical protein